MRGLLSDDFRVYGTMFHEKCSNKLFSIKAKLPLNKMLKHREVTTKPKVLFYFFKNVHIPILIPLYKKLKELHPEADIAFGYKSFEPMMRAGFSLKELKELKSYQEAMYINPQHFFPDITYVADAVYDWVEGCGKLVNVGHGILSKGLYYSDTELSRREEQADLVFVPGVYHKNVMEKIISTPVIASGMPKLDVLFKGELIKGVIEETLGLLDKNYKYVLFAPTFNDELSCIPHVLNDVVKVIPEGKNYKLIIKLHGTTSDKYKNMYKELSKSDDRVIFIDSLDITPLLAISDIMISDVSSAMIEFAALNKPVVLFNSPDRFSYKNYKEDDIEYKFRAIGREVNNLTEMIEAVADSFNAPLEYEQQRVSLTDKLLANKKGANACEIIVNDSFKAFL